MWLYVTMWLCSLLWKSFLYLYKQQMTTICSIDNHLQLPLRFYVPFFLSYCGNSPKHLHFLWLLGQEAHLGYTTPLKGSCILGDVQKTFWFFRWLSGGNNWFLVFHHVPIDPPPHLVKTQSKSSLSISYRENKFWLSQNLEFKLCSCW